jgi:DNA-binding winged helix-turn-helix (wHTH) protein
MPVVRATATSTQGNDVLEVGPLEIVPEEHLARTSGRTLTLSIREQRLLVELARRADRIVSREDLFALVWGRAMRPGDRSVDVYVRKLRVKLDLAQPDWTFIHTHFGFGYRLAPVRKPSPGSARDAHGAGNGPGARVPPEDRDRHAQHAAGGPPLEQQRVPARW